MSVWKENEVLIECYPGLWPKKHWVVVCPFKDTHKPGQMARAKEAELADFPTLDEAKAYCNENNLRLVYWEIEQ